MTFRSSRVPRPSVAALGLVLAALLAAPSAVARVEVTLDADSLNELIVNMAPERVPVKLVGDRALNILLQDLKVTGFDPAAGDEGRGHVLTSLRLKVPELGLDVPLAPRLSLQFKDAKSGKVAYLRFEEARIEMPLTGPVDVASLLPLLPITADTEWVIGSQRGNVRVAPKLVDARLGAKNLRLSFDLEVGSASPAGGGTR